jgi:hypothetical protein
MLGTYLRAAMAVSESLKRAKSVTYSTVFFSTLQRAYRVSTCVLCINRDAPPLHPRWHPVRLHRLHLTLLRRHRRTRLPLLPLRPQTRDSRIICRGGPSLEQQLDLAERQATGLALTEICRTKPVSTSRSMMRVASNDLDGGRRWEGWERQGMGLTCA